MRNIIIPEYCAEKAQYSLCTNNAKGLLQRREGMKITPLVIFIPNVVNPVWHCIYSAITALWVDFARLACKIQVIGVLFLAVSAIKAAEVPRLPFVFASMTTEPITVDGSLSEPCWARSPVAGAFVDIYDNSKVSAVQTSFRMLYDAKNLYIGIEAQDPEPGKLEMKKTEHDVWPSGDVLELFLDPGLTRNKYYQFAVGLGGGQYEGCMLDPKWNIQWQAVTRVNDKGWSAEIAIPFSEMKISPPVNGDVWGLNVCRDRKGGQQNSSSWAAVGGNFHKSYDFNVLIFGNAADYVKKERIRELNRMYAFQKQLRENELTHTALGQKIQAAADLVKKLDEARKIAPDDMQGFLSFFDQIVKLRNSQSILYKEMVFGKVDFGPDQPYDKLSNTVVTPHIPFARPYAGGAVEALVIAPCWTQRDTVELSQRLSLDYTPLMTESYEKFGPFQSDYKRESYLEISAGQFNDVVQTRLLADVMYDVVIIGRMGWTNAFPEAVRSAILNKVRSGAGLVYIAPTNLSSDLEQAMKDDAQDLSAITCGIPLNVVPALKEAKIRTGRLGKGRLVFISYAEIQSKDWLTKSGLLESLTPYQDYDPFQYEYSCALLARATLWASGKEATVLFQGLDTQPRKIQRNELSAAKISFSLAGIPSDSRVEYVIRDNSSRVEFSKSQDAKEGENNLPLPLLMKGEKVVDIWLKDSDGKVINWASCPLSVAAPVGIENVTVGQEIYQKGEPVKGEVILTDGNYEKLSLLVSARDNYGREVARLSLPVKGKQTAFDLQVSDPLTSAFKLEVALNAGKEPVDIMEKPFYINHIGAAPVDDFMFIMWACARSVGYNTKLFLDRMAAADVDVVYNTSSVWDGYDKSREIALRLARANLRAAPMVTRMFLVASGIDHLKPVVGKDGPEIRNCSISNPPEEMNLGDFKGFDHLRDMARAYGPLSPAFYSLGDENAISAPPEDVCFCAKCQESFRKMMKQTYKDLAALNEEWGANYKDWGEVKPITLVDAHKEKRYPPWVDHRLHMDERFTEYHVAAVKAILGVDSKARVGIEGPIYPSLSFTGFNLYRMVSQFRFFGPYDGLPENHVFSYLQPDSIASAWYGSYVNYTSESDMRYSPWHFLFKGMNSAMWWTAGGSGLGGPAIFSPDYAPLPMFAWTCEEIREIKAGIGKLLVTSQRQTDAIALYLSNPSLHAATLQRPPEWDWARPSQWNKSLKDFHSMLMDAGYEYRYLSPDDLQAGKLDQVKALLLPCSQAISAKDAELIRNFVNRGGLLIADSVPGTMDEHGKAQAKSSLTDVFGEFTRMHVQSYGKGKAVYLGDFTGEYSDKRKQGEKKDVPSTIVRLMTDLGGIKPFVRLVGQNGEAQIRQDIEISVFHNGKAAYLCLLRGYVSQAVAAKGPEAVGGGGGVAGEKSPDIQVQLPAQYHVYDVRGKQYLNCVEGFKTKLEPAQAKVFALLPAKLEKMEIKAEKNRYNYGEKVNYTVQMLPSSLKGCGLAVRVEVFGPDGKILPWYTRKIVSQEGVFKGELPLSLNEPAGKYRLVAHDIVGGTSVETAFDVKM